MLFRYGIQGNGNLFLNHVGKIIIAFPSYDVAKIIKEVICAVYYLHNMDPPIIHRDIKLENALIDKNGVAKLTDFLILVDQITSIVKK